MKTAELLMLIPMACVWVIFLVAYAPRCLRPWLPRSWRRR